MAYYVTKSHVPSFQHAGVLFRYMAVDKNDSQTYTRPKKPSLNGVKENLFPSVFLKVGRGRRLHKKSFIYIYIKPQT